MKFDIVKYIDDLCSRYYRGIDTQEETINNIKNALKDNSWQNLCNNKEVTEVYDNTDTGVIEVNNDAWFVHLDWCIKNKTEDNK
mgnify:CR=1 FL=1